MKTSCIYFAMLALFFACGRASSSSDEEIGGALPTGAHPSTENPGDDPSQGPIAQVRGFYSNGKLQQPTALPVEGAGYTKLFRTRDRRYASFDLIYLLQRVAKQMAEAYPEAKDHMQIGDVAAETGGEVSGHASHQNGLDADIAYFRVNETEQDPNDARGFAEIFVEKGKLTANFDLARNWQALKFFLSSGRVQRVFVNEVVKKGLCEYAKKIGDFADFQQTLRRIRPYEGHEDHFHLRLTCPIHSPDCISQEEVPPEIGC